MLIALKCPPALSFDRWLQAEEKTTQSKKYLNKQKNEK
jgi:hypothetical protein